MPSTRTIPRSGCGPACQVSAAAAIDIKPTEANPAAAPSCKPPSLPTMPPAISATPKLDESRSTPTSWAAISLIVVRCYPGGLGRARYAQAGIVRGVIVRWRSQIAVGGHLRTPAPSYRPDDGESGRLECRQHSLGLALRARQACTLDAAERLGQLREALRKLAGHEREVDLELLVGVVR